MTWTKLPAWTGPVHIGCGNCSPVPANTPTCRLDRPLCVGFGDVAVTRDGEEVYSEQAWLWQQGQRRPAGLSDEDIEMALEAGPLWDEPDTYPTLADYEAQALTDPDHDWRVHFYAALHEETYQRHGDGLWVLIESGQGFA